jgi:hypothetical protein
VTHVADSWTLERLMSFHLSEATEFMVLGGYFEEALDPICVGGYLFTAGGYQTFRNKPHISSATSA